MGLQLEDKQKEADRMKKQSQYLNNLILHFQREMAAQAQTAAKEAANAKSQKNLIVPGATKNKPKALSMRRQSQEQENLMMNTLGKNAQLSMNPMVANKNRAVSMQPNGITGIGKIETVNTNNDDLISVNTYGIDGGQGLNAQNHMRNS